MPPGPSPATVFSSDDPRRYESPPSPLYANTVRLDLSQLLVEFDGETFRVLPQELVQLREEDARYGAPLESSVSRIQHLRSGEAAAATIDALLDDTRQYAGLSPEQRSEHARFLHWTPEERVRPIEAAGFSMSIDGYIVRGSYVPGPGGPEEPSVSPMAASVPPPPPGPRRTAWERILESEL